MVCAGHSNRCVRSSYRPFLNRWAAGSASHRALTLPEAWYPPAGARLRFREVPRNRRGNRHLPAETAGSRTVDLNNTKEGRCWSTSRSADRPAAIFAGAWWCGPPTGGQEVCDRYISIGKECRVQLIQRPHARSGMPASGIGPCSAVSRYPQSGSPGALYSDGQVLV